jgi:hypothetical protein
MNTNVSSFAKISVHSRTPGIQLIRFFLSFFPIRVTIIAAVVAGMEVLMKKILLAGLIFSVASLSSYGLGLYFDAGIGVGPAWTSFDGDDFVKEEEKTATGDAGGHFDEFAIDLGLKLGVGPFDTIPIYVVGVLGSIGHRISDSHDDYFQFNSYLIGPGVIFYPTPFVQIAGSLGFSFVSNENSIGRKEHMYDSKGGFAGDISVAGDLGTGNHALLMGLRFFGSTNTLETEGDVQNNIMVSIFIRYAFRHKR